MSDNAIMSLSQAIEVIISSETLSKDQCAALEAKITSISDANVQIVVDMTRTAHEELVPLLSNTNESTLYRSIELSLAGWEIAWQYRLDKSYLSKISRSQREYRKYSESAFDVRQLSEKERDLLFVLAYAQVKPLDHCTYLRVYQQCLAFAETGRLVRIRTQYYMRKSTILAPAFLLLEPEKKRNSKKRKREQPDTCSFELTAALSLPDTGMYHNTPLIDSVHNAGELHDQTMYTETNPEMFLNYDLFDTDPQAIDDPWGYSFFCQANTMSTTRPDVTLTGSGPEWT
ncbi:hypothetical protein ST47_g2227 [Ascochyta rabiei]|uniref:Uncharacterized protein n=1 Tax=Didymella rabiei TaxID=5454 RepID=A0A163JNF0_DIDRA|nr:hypothetical protein ST47_g2227 [Ascochyta rabiei]